MDIFTPEKRSFVMGRIRSKDSKPERVVRSLLHRMGFRFRIHVKKLPGQPDIVLPKWKCVIFVHGCFWHRHQECKTGTQVPSANREYWEAKFVRNVARDKRIWTELESLGWHVITVWECEVKKGNWEALRRGLFEEIVGDGLDYLE